MSIDRVAEVRRVAIKAVRSCPWICRDTCCRSVRVQLSACYRKYSSEENDTAMQVFLDDCQRTFTSSDDWKLRQCYIHLCQAIFDLHVDSGDQYALRFLVHLLALKDDPVVNVRLSLGQFLFENLLHTGKRSRSRSLRSMSNCLFACVLQTFRTIGELNSINVCRVFWSTEIEMFVQPSEESISREESPCQLINSSPIVMFRMNPTSRRHRHRHRINSQSTHRSTRAASLLCFTAHLPCGSSSLASLPSNNKSMSTENN